MFRLVAGLCLALSLGFAETQPPDPMFEPGVYNYTITAAKLGKWEMVNDHLLPYYYAHSEEIAKLPNPQPGEIHNMDEMTAWTRTHYVAMTRIIEQSGMGLREYLTMGIVLNFSLGVNSARDRGVPVPAEYHINEANMTFVKANIAKITDLFKKYQTLFMMHK